MLLSGDLDLFPTPYYNVVALEEAGTGVRVELSSAVEDAYTQFFVVANKSFIEENEEVGVAIQKAYIRAWERAKENPQLLYDALASSNYTAEQMKASYDFDETFEYFHTNNTKEDIAKLQDTIDFLYDGGFITTKVDANEFVDNSYYEKAVEELKAE